MKNIFSVIVTTLLCTLIVTAPVVQAAGSSVSAVALNNPYTTPYKNMNLLADHIRAAVPGSYIRFATYSIDNVMTVNELIAARERGVRVQIIVREALTTTSYKTLKAALGDTYSKTGSFIIKCYHACRGSDAASGINSMHSKLFLFSNTTGGSVWALGSFHPTEYSSKYQFNDLVFAQDQCVYNEFITVFYQMTADKPAAARKPLLCGKFYLMVYPQPIDGRDMFIEALNKVQCTGATGGTGSGGRTVIRVQHASMRGSRGYEFAAKLKQLHKAGCMVDVILGPDGNVADAIITKDKYLRGMNVIQRTTPTAAATHMKSMLISGNYGGDSSSRLVYTGSLNQEDGQHYRDDIQLRINDNAVFLQYVSQFNEAKRYYNKPLSISDL